MCNYYRPTEDETIYNVSIFSQIDRIEKHCQLQDKNLIEERWSQIKNNLAKTGFISFCIGVLSFCVNRIQKLKAFLGKIIKKTNSLIVDRTLVFKQFLMSLFSIMAHNLLQRLISYIFGESRRSEIQQDVSKESRNVLLEPQCASLNHQNSTEIFRRNLRVLGPEGYLCMRKIARLKDKICILISEEASLSNRYRHLELGVSWLSLDKSIGRNYAQLTLEQRSALLQATRRCRECFNSYRLELINSQVT